MKPILHAENVGKQYRIDGQRARYATLRESLSATFSAPWRRPRGAAARRSEKIWALKDVSLDVQRGEVLGIIGRNGDGKSTLLKVLSRITDPTTGLVDLYGRVGSLLEVGTGFHPELTGRENILLNGAILGMKRREILCHFDRMVAFAELEQFIDTPVKRYSSGMYLRLAFAVAAHLEPEILVIDEVLAVGDAAFQKACLGKLNEVARQGRTVLFVSHHMPAVKSLCTRVVHLSQGTIVDDGPPQAVVATYLAAAQETLSAERRWDVAERPGSSQFRLCSLRVLDPRGEVTGVYSSSEPIVIEMEFELESLHSALVVGFDLINHDGVVVFKSLHNDRHPRDWPPVKAGHNRIRCEIPAGLLNGGTYSVAPKVGLHSIAYFLNGEAEVSFDVLLDHSESPFWNAASRDKFTGVIAPCLAWRKS
jgi:lipopolysaccharide transport system ATP-binding protein